MAADTNFAFVSENKNHFAFDFTFLNFDSKSLSSFDVSNAFDDSFIVEVFAFKNSYFFKVKIADFTFVFALSLSNWSFMENLYSNLNSSCVNWNRKVIPAFECFISFANFDLKTINVDPYSDFVYFVKFTHASSYLVKMDMTKNFKFLHFEFIVDFFRL